MLKNLSIQTLFSISLLFLNSQLTANDAPIILPGAPGKGLSEQEGSQEGQ